MQIIEFSIVALAVALAIVWLAKRFGFQKSRGCGGATTCQCPKPSLPPHLEKRDSP